MNALSGKKSPPEGATLKIFLIVVDILSILIIATA